MVNDNGSEFITSVTVRMGDADSTSRAYPSRFFEWSHRAFEDLLMCAGDSLQAMFEEEDWGMPLVHAELHVVRGPSFDERLKIRLRLERLSVVHFKGNAPRAVPVAYIMKNLFEGAQRTTEFVKNSRLLKKQSSTHQFVFNFIFAIGMRRGLRDLFEFGAAQRL